MHIASLGGAGDAIIMDDGRNPEIRYPGGDGGFKRVSAHQTQCTLR